MLRQDTKENLKNTFRESLLILIYEFLGTFMMGTLFINYGKYERLGLINDFHKSTAIKY